MDEVESDQQPGCLHPRERYDLFGQETAEQSFAAAWASGRLHHAWLITGPAGVGKASFAYRAARRALGAAPDAGRGPLGSAPDDPVCRRIEAAAHPDLLLLRRPFDEKRKRWRAEITVTEARRAPAFFSKSAGGDGWRVAIVDAADDMNNSAANALLKTLEEPPQRGLLFLIAHSPGRLPATIRSRCRRLTLRAPSIEATAAWLTGAGGMEDAEEARFAAAMADGAPGKALALTAIGGARTAAAVDAFLDKGGSASDDIIRTLADQVTGKGSDAARKVMFDHLSRQLRARAREAALAGGDASPWLAAWREIGALVREADALYLDPKQTVLEALGRARQAARSPQPA